MEAYSVKRFVDQFVFSDTKHIMQDNPYQAFALITVGIEILGKCFCRGNWDNTGSSEDCFNMAIQRCKELEKYQKYTIFVQSKTCRPKEGNKLYRLLRCGMAHSLKPQDKLVLVPWTNDLENDIIGCEELYDDAMAAWRSIKDGKTKIKKDLNEVIFYVDDEIAASGGTPFNVTKEE